jgi:Flp pilus assembly protein TadG
MKKALIRRSRICRRDAGVTMIFVAICMVAIVAMAALSIDVVTLYLARMEAQRTADAAALAAARVISLSGITGDPNDNSGDWSQICGGSTGVATLAAQAVATQTVDQVAPAVTVTYSAGGTSNASCVGLPAAFGVNPMVTVQVTRSNLPTFFSHMWGNTGSTTTATATAEAFNPSNSGSVGNSETGVITPVWPRCVKPWMVPNLDPLNSAHCTTGCTGFVDSVSGQIKKPGISLNGGNAGGVIGEQFYLSPDCSGFGSSCTLQTAPQANYTHTPTIPSNDLPNLLYVPGQALNASVAVPSAASGGDLYEQAIAGCDQTTQYQCGTLNANTVDLTAENPAASGDTTNGVTALIGENNPSSNQPDGQDYLNAYASPSSYPFQILAGGSNPYLSAGSAVSGSSSIVTVPIYYYTGSSTQIGPATTPVTIVGFLQVFINAVDLYGNVNVTVLNVSGCGNGTNTTGTAVTGSSPVPIRLVAQ